MKLSTRKLFDLLMQPQMGVNLTDKQWQDCIFVLRESKLLAALYHSANKNGCYEQYSTFAKKHLVSASIYANRQADQIRYESAELRDLLEHINVTVIFLKGAAYTLRNSLNSHGRICSDLDVLVNKSDLSKAEAHLKVNRWRSEPLSDYDEKYYREWAHEIPPLIQINRATVVDMHHNIYPPISGRSPLISEFISSKEKTQSGCFVLDPVATVMHSIIHMFANEDSSSWMRDLYDIYLLIEEYSDDKFWKQLSLLAKKTDFGFEFVCCMRVLEHYTGFDVPQSADDYCQQIALSNIQEWFIRNAVIPAVVPEHELTLGRQQAWGKRWVYFRGHWIKMPFTVLIKHFVVKSFLSIRDKIMGKHHFDPQLPKNPNW
ncbi:nucleotidyltransferase family protein [Aliiglaciecola sp. M165]|uniref:nucleotidyltransferase family protein n=1 Tax=Aliiglaciecola sp. M165 TaxID=2593649 RepID=UPI00117F4183|nr:nucleotidyltransferase family protein [Aliiglaciecola sp. M165]TRY29562.1 nucleotidyltransferase family protein [Aliiglaciecola sp. M165]